MSTNSLSTIEIDAIGEVLNISLGASATAVSTMLSTRVDITTPDVRVLSREEFQFAELEPAIGVEITYVSGLSGRNMMLLKREDVRMIVGMLMGAPIPEEEFEMNELTVSAVCEVMNQMMGASSTALSELFGRIVNISTPSSFEVNSINEFRDRYYGDENTMVVIRFILKIEDKVESEFLNIMPIELAKDMVSGFFPDGAPEMEEETASAAPVQQEEQPQPVVNEVPVQPQQEETAATIEPQPAMQPQMPVQEMPQSQAPVQQTPVQPAPVQQSYSAGEQGLAKDMMAVMQQQQQQFMEQMQQMQQMMQTSMQTMMQNQASGPKQIQVQTMSRPTLSAGGTQLAVGNGEDVNMDLIMGVPLDISVEIGRTKKLVKEILEFSKGTLVVLDKAAGEQVDLFVNGQCVAKGDVVVIDDNFGIRITEVLKESIKF